MGIKRRLESRLRFPIIDNDNNTTNVWNLRRFRSSPLFPTRHSGRFAPIFYFNCEHFFLYIVKQKRKKSWIFKISWKSNFVGGQFLIIHQPFLGSCEVPQKIGADRFTCFDVYWIQTNRHPPIQKSIYIRVLLGHCSLHLVKSEVI